MAGSVLYKRSLKGYIKDLIWCYRYSFLAKAFSIPSHVTIQERVKLYSLSINCRKILEIGSYLGSSACCFAINARNNNGEVICIDTWFNDAMSDGRKDTYQTFMQNTANYRNTIKPIRKKALKLLSS